MDAHSGHYSGHAACSGCSLCLLACPVWHATRDIRFTPHGRAKALQHGTQVLDLAASVDSCTLCGACEPACPEEIDLVGMLVELRGELNRSMPARTRYVDEQMRPSDEREDPHHAVATRIFPDRALAANAALLEQVVQLFGGLSKAAPAADDGSDIALALEAGLAVSDARKKSFLATLRPAKRLVVGDGILLRALRAWLPGKRIESLGVATSSLAAVRKNLRAGDMYIIEPRAYHADRERLIKYYDALRISHGCAMNLDLQRLAIPTTSGSLPHLLGVSVVDPAEQARWILEGYDFSRVIVEDVNDLAVFRSVTNKPVLHLAQLASVE